MAKVFGLHRVRLRRGINAEEFEKFVTEEVFPLPWSGLSVHLLKGDRGDREGKYLWVYEFESIEAREEVFPEGQLSEEFQQFFESHAAVWEKCNTFAHPLPDPFNTDYVVVGE